jgi:bacteriocin-like protein
MINAINPKNNDENNDVTIAGTDFFTDTESFLNELTDDELQQVRGGAQAIDDDFNDGPSELSLALCG